MDIEIIWRNTNKKELDDWRVELSRRGINRLQLDIGGHALELGEGNRSKESFLMENLERGSYFKLL